MTFTDRLDGIADWANIHRVDCQLAGAYEQADKFDAVMQIIGICKTQANLITTLEESLRHRESEIARLESLVHRG